ncbi:MAG TPA: FlgD immunoglobulin-like domain containing protein [Rhodothermales bacterium]|nr:FlgD immunoglobulin-like domain containing protein [Rhodothermales bacterium]
MIRIRSTALTLAAVSSLSLMAAAQAQTLPGEDFRIGKTAAFGSISGNSVTNLHAEGDTVWVGPLGDYSHDRGANWISAGADSLSIRRGRMFSIDVEGPTVWIGIGYSQRTTTSGSVDFVPTALGFNFSTDGGRTWDFRLPQLDQPNDTVEVYGVSTLKALPIIVPEQSPPFDIDFDPETGWIWTAAWASGIRRSEDGGRTWNRVVLPPDTLDEITPDRLYDFPFAPERGPADEANNFLGFSVLVDETGTVWAGTAGGLNRSEDARVAGRDASWRRFHYDGTTRGLVGNWITSIEEQPMEGRNTIWAACWPATEQGEDFGITVTRDGGETFEQVLVGAKVYDFAFDGETVYAAGDDGLFITSDGGQTWETVRYFTDADRPDRPVRPDATVFSVAKTLSDLWVGTDDGLMRSSDSAGTWSLFRSEVPLQADTPNASAPGVDTYAYPNPYAPSSDGYLKIRFELPTSESVTVRVFDFGSTVVRTFDLSAASPGVREVVWNGTDDRGVQVANGVYFYTVEKSNETVSGKILVID